MLILLTLALVVPVLSAVGILLALDGYQARHSWVITATKPPAPYLPDVQEYNLRKLALMDPGRRSWLDEWVFDADAVPEGMDPRRLAEIFGRRALELIVSGKDPKQIARLAASFAFLAEPSLREQPMMRSRRPFPRHPGWTVVH